MYQTPEGLMEVRIQHVVFTKLIKGGEKFTRQARLITYVDERKHRLVQLLTNDMEYDPLEIIDLPQTLGDRIALQADKAKLPAQVLLWRKCKCHQDTDAQHLIKCWDTL